MRYLVDANVWSEIIKPSPNTKVLAWLRQNESQLFVNPIILGEIEYGILLLAPSKKRDRLESWFRGLSDRVNCIDFDSTTASVWAHLLAKLKQKGKTMPFKDSLIAATAAAYDLTIVTRDVGDFEHSEITILNPWV